MPVVQGIKFHQLGVFGKSPPATRQLPKEGSEMIRAFCRFGVLDREKCTGDAQKKMKGLIFFD
jgi:hypothetical protein